MPTIAAAPPAAANPFASAAPPATSARLSDAQTGTGPSTNILDRGGDVGPALVQIVSTVGGSPSATVALEGSVDGTTWFAVPYQDPATPGTLSVATFNITTATTTRRYLPGGYGYRFFRLNYPANTNVTLTADVFPFRA